MEVKSISEDYVNEIESLVNLFGLTDFCCTHNRTVQNANVTHNLHISSQSIGLDRDISFSYTSNEEQDALMQKSIDKRLLKVALYDTLSAFLNKQLPWGSLTGVRPTKFARDLMERFGVKEHLLVETLEKDYRVSKEKAKLVANILKNQKCIIRNDHLVDLYINIPICPTRCLYCSFISHEIGAVKDKVEKYLDCLISELDAVKQIITDKAYIVRNIYIGGGTPSVLSAVQLERLLSEIVFSVDEFTVECGRPDTITEEKLDILKKYGVTRISINPQTFSEKTLKRIGRKHTIDDVLSAYSLALSKGFVVNMDIIAGLPGESYRTFKKTIETLLELAPDNITIHTLSVKRGAALKDNIDILNDREVEKMIEFGQKSMLENNYKPYYIYRQKNQLKGLENVGYFRDNVCKFNIDSMEETNSIIAIGAGALSKRVSTIENRIERQSNAKFLYEYIENIDEIIKKKKEFFK